MSFCCYCGCFVSSFVSFFFLLNNSISFRTRQLQVISGFFFGAWNKFAINSRERPHFCSGEVIFIWNALLDSSNPPKQRSIRNAQILSVTVQQAISCLFPFPCKVRVYWKLGNRIFPSLIKVTISTSPCCEIRASANRSQHPITVHCIKTEMIVI